jgi:hypothetical protein
MVELNDVRLLGRRQQGAKYPALQQGKRGPNLAGFKARDADLATPAEGLPIASISAIDVTGLTEA